MSENKRKHLEFIHNTINRMSTNSFIIKGWLVAIISALFIFADLEKNKQYIAIAWITVPTFWYLNAKFLQNERKFRALFDKVRLQEKVDFSMKTDEYDGPFYSILSALRAKTIWPLYSSVLFIILLIFYWF